ncbi:ubiquinone biosynthesis protein UbiB [Gammaproteobacteria bacterium]|nr:ubiquinone biosynthesis protein UbiB [Gammaproteobacteria bacterium]
MQIILIFVRFGLYDLVFNLPVLRYFRWLIPIINLIFNVSKKPRAQRLRLALEKLGPTFIKLGQALSTRRDLLPEDVADELAKLQDNVPGFAVEIAIEVIETSFNKPLNELFKSFDKIPIAAASIAQVHGAILFNGDSVIVKIVRPNIEKVIIRDIALMRILGKIAEKYWKDGKRMRPLEVIAEYERSILNELDLSLEASNGDLLKRNFADSKILYVPIIYWDLTRKNVLVMERISGIPVSQVEQLKALGVDIPLLAKRSVEVFFAQVFKHSFFHADMHPGNIFVDATNPADPTYIALDFGMMGSLNSKDQRYLADNFMAFFNRDYRRVAQLHVESGWVPTNTSVDEFEIAVRSLCEPIFNKQLKDISFGGFLLSLFSVARRFNMEIQPQLLLLQKTLLAVEGLGRHLYPELDLWTTAKPYLTKFVTQRSGPKATLKRYQADIPIWIEYLPDTIHDAHLLLTKALNNDLETKISPKTIEELKQTFFKHQKQQSLSQYGAVILLLSGGSSLFTGHIAFWNIIGFLISALFFILSLR